MACLIKRRDSDVGKTLIAKPDFTIVVFPDQGQAVSNGTSWEALKDWVISNRVTRNILAVLSVGDITPDHAAEDWDTVLSGYNEIAATGIACLPLIGNHDYDSISARTATSFNAHFGPSWFSGKSYYGASTYPESNNRNYYITFDLLDKHWLIIGLEIFPPADAIAWAVGVIEANPTKDIIIVTHGYLNQDGTRTAYDDTYGPVTYWGAAPKDANGGDELWTELVKLYENIRMVICGHMIGASPAVFVYHNDAVGDNANTVLQLFTNYQGDTNGGNGHCVLLKFRGNRLTCTPYKARATEGVDTRYPEWQWSW